MNQPSPFELELTHDGPDDYNIGHSWIQIQPKYFAATFHDITLTEYLTAHRWIGSILGKLAATIAPELATAAAGHECLNWHSPTRPGCGVTSAIGLSPTPATIRGDDGPCLTIDVPIEALDHWVARTSAVLKDLIAADSKRPQPKDERAWAAPSHHQEHLTVANLTTTSTRSEITQ